MYSLPHILRECGHDQEIGDDVTHCTSSLVLLCGNRSQLTVRKLPRASFQIVGLAFLQYNRLGRIHNHREPNGLGTQVQRAKVSNSVD